MYVESRGAAAGVGRANHCTSTGGPHWASRAEIAKMADAAFVQPSTRYYESFLSDDGECRFEKERQSPYRTQDRH